MQATHGSSYMYPVITRVPKGVRDLCTSHTQGGALRLPSGSVSACMHQNEWVSADLHIAKQKEVDDPVNDIKPHRVYMYSDL